jgi:hypothetical protein
MKTSLIAAFVVVVCLFAQMIHAQDSVVARNQIQLGIYISAIKGDTSYTYNYQLRNGGSSQQSIWQFWLITPPDAAISMVGSPIGWHSANRIIDNQRLVEWGTVNAFQISPGSSLGGSSLRASSPPGIVRYYSEGYAPPPIWPDGMAEDSIPGYTDLTPYGPGVVGTTVGPATSRLQIYPTALIDTIVSFVYQSRSLGWIASQSVAEKYTGMFSRTKTDLVQGHVALAKSRIDSILQEINTDSATTVGSQAYVLIRFNADYLKSMLQTSPKVKGGLFGLQITSTLSVRANPSSSFSNRDTLVAISATVRWQSRYSLTLGTVSSPIYGFGKYGTVTTVGSYNYQQFRTATHVPLNWTANTEYELFTVPVNGCAGVEEFTLTNALSGGQWFVDIDYLDKTDSIFYQPVATCTGR